MIVEALVLINRSIVVSFTSVETFFDKTATKARKTKNINNILTFLTTSDTYVHLRVIASNTDQ